MKTVTIFGFYKFDPFDLASYEKLKSIFKIIALAVFLSLLYCHVVYFIPFFYTLVNSDGVEVVASFMMSLMGFILSFIALKGIQDLPDHFLTKINADHKLKEFNLEKESGILKFTVREDINANGFFSAKGYWEIYFQNKYYAEIKELRNKYPNVYSKDDENTGQKKILISEK